MHSKRRWIGSIATVALVSVALILLASSPAQPATGDVADLGITKTDSPDPVNTGELLTYAIQVTNQGPQGATGVTVTDKLPNHTDFVSASASSGNCKEHGSAVSCDLGNLAADATKANALTITIQVRPTKAGTLTNSASVAGAESDPVMANNTATATTTVVAPHVVTCRGVNATIVGTGGADRLVGTGGADVIAAFGGADVISGLAGSDLICAGGGNDSVTGGSAADRVFGGGGADLLRGRGGPDLLAGNPGNDILSGNAGNDRLRGGTGSDRCQGGPGRDSERGCER